MIFIYFCIYMYTQPHTHITVRVCVALVNQRPVCLSLHILSTGMSSYVGVNWPDGVHALSLTILMSTSLNWSGLTSGRSDQWLDWPVSWPSWTYWTLGENVAKITCEFQSIKDENEKDYIKEKDGGGVVKWRGELRYCVGVPVVTCSIDPPC